MAKPCSWSNPLEKNWILLGADVTSPAKCAAAVVSQPTTYETSRFFKCQICNLCRKTQVKLQITVQWALKIDMHQPKNPVKCMIAKIPIIKKTLFYTDEKQPGGNVFRCFLMFLDVFRHLFGTCRPRVTIEGNRVTRVSLSSQ